MIGKASRVEPHQAEHDQARCIMTDPEIEQDPEPEARDDRDYRKFGRELGGCSSRRKHFEIGHCIEDRRNQQGDGNGELDQPDLGLRNHRRPDQPAEHQCKRAPDDQHRVDEQPKQDQEDEGLGMDGSEWPTSIVAGIRRSGTSLRNLNQAMVGANDPIPRVSKKLVTAPSSRPSAFGRSSSSAPRGKGRS